MERSYLLMGLAAILVFFAAWVWLTVSVWKINPLGAVLSFFLGIPALYYLIKYWHDDKLNIRAPFFTNLALNMGAFILVICVAMLQSHSRTKKLERKKENALTGSDLILERWCREKNDAVYSPGLGTCIEAEPDIRADTQKTGPDTKRQTK
jgi:hypothetical protein